MTTSPIIRILYSYKARDADNTYHTVKTSLMSTTELAKIKTGFWFFKKWNLTKRQQRINIRSIDASQKVIYIPNAQLLCIPTPDCIK